MSALKNRGCTLFLSGISAVNNRGKAMCPLKKARMDIVSAVFKRGYLKIISFAPAVGSSIQRLWHHVSNKRSLTTTCQGTGPLLNYFPLLIYFFNLNKKSFFLKFAQTAPRASLDAMHYSTLNLRCLLTDFCMVVS